VGQLAEQRADDLDVGREEVEEVLGLEDEGPRLGDRRGVTRTQLAAQDVDGTERLPGAAPQRLAVASDQIDLALDDAIQRIGRLVALVDDAARLDQISLAIEASWSTCSALQARTGPLPYSRTTFSMSAIFFIGPDLRRRIPRQGRTPRLPLQPSLATTHSGSRGGSWL
jgi:hypothetical protein